MNHAPRQAEFRFRTRKAKPAAGVYRRPDSRYWWARIWIGSTLHRRSTGALTRGGALIGLQAWKLQLQRHGPPARTGGASLSNQRDGTIGASDAELFGPYRSPMRAPSATRG